MLIFVDCPPLPQFESGLAPSSADSVIPTQIPTAYDMRKEGVTYLRLFGMSTVLANVSRYEAAIERSLHRALHDPVRRQARRRGEAVTAPIAVDIAESGDLAGAPREAGRAD